MMSFIWREIGDNSKKIIVAEIDGFNYDEGYQYKLNISEKVQAEPYDVNYLLLEILSKEEID